jgi:hypothetical protein
VAALGATACSGGRSRAQAPASASTRLAGTSTTRVAPSSADVALARRLLLRAKDLPKRWRVISAAATVAASDAAQQRLCPSVARARRVLTRSGVSTPVSIAFSPGATGAPIIVSKVSIASDAAVAQRLFDLIASRAFVTCAARAIAARSPNAPRVAAIQVPRAGDDAAGWQAAMLTTNGGASYEVRVVVVAIRAARVVHELVFVDADLLPIPPATRNAAIVAAGRLAQAATSRSRS